MTTTPLEETAQRLDGAHAALARVRAHCRTLPATRSTQGEIALLGRMLKAATALSVHMTMLVDGLTDDVAPLPDIIGLCEMAEEFERELPAGAAPGFPAAPF
jgi:hypothetical protein